LATRATLPGLAAQSPPASTADTTTSVYEQLARQYAQFQGVDRTFELVARAVSPAVVHIVARKKGVRDDGSAARFEETGSGVIVAADADRGLGRYVLTNHHVVQGAAPADTAIYLHDGRVLRPEQIWTDQKADVAVLKLGLANLPTARLGDSDRVAVGTWVLAVGSPFGLTHSVSQGIISARGRYEAELEEDGVENQDFLQTDAAINPGNSGGPLVNLKGEVVGLNTAIASNGGGSEGVGFSIPINLARWALNQLVEHGRVRRGGIGVILDVLTPETAQAVGLERPRGARVNAITPGSPAERSGLAPGDVILRFNDVEVIDHNHLINLVSVTPVGQDARLTVWRGGRAVEVGVVVADRGAILPPRVPTDVPRTGPGGFLRRPRPSDSPPAEHTPDDASPAGITTGLTFAPIDGPAAARRYGLPEVTRGLLVTRVEPDAPLAQVIQPSDLIQALDGVAAEDADALRAALATKGEHTIQFQRVEDGTPRTRIIQVEVP
jgi:serine protease Do